MRRLQINVLGEPANALELVEFDVLTPDPGQVLVQMEAATLNEADVLYIAGKFYVTPEPPAATVGAEGVGRVLAAGSPADQALVGSRVIFVPFPTRGSFATHTVVNAEDVITVPEHVDASQLAMLGIAGMTAYQLIRGHGDPMAAGRWIGQTQGSSGIGEYIVKTAKRYGWKTLNVVRRPESVDMVRSWGADAVVVGDDDLRDNVARALGQDELDIVVDAVSGDVGQVLVDKLRYGGTVVSFVPSSRNPPVQVPGNLIGRQVKWTGFSLVNWITLNDPATRRRAYEDLVNLVADGSLSTRVHTTFDLSDWKEAFAMVTGDVRRDGKVLFVYDK